MVAHDAFVIVLAEDEEEGIGSYLFPGITQTDACLPLPICPNVSASAALTKF
jgi:hypothetical protein